jgi:hypothetical protein
MADEEREAAHTVAIDAYQRELALREATGAEATELALVRRNLASALWEHGQRARAVALMKTSRDALRDAGPLSQAELTLAERWLAETASAGSR